MTVGDRIKHRRKELGINAEQLAKALGVHRSTIFRYENGGIEKLPGDALVPIAEALHTTPAYLMGWEYDPETTTDIDLALMEHLSEESRSGRAAMAEQFIQKFGTEHGVHMIRLINGKHIFMYYHAFNESRYTSAASAFMEKLEGLTPEAAEHLELLIEAYYAADARGRQMVDLALDPFLPEDVKDWYGPLAQEDDAQELAHQILQDKKAEERSSALHGAAGKKKEA